MNNDYFEHIEDYLSGNLSREDHKQFENALKKDADLQFAVDHYGAILKVTEEKSHEKYTSLVKSIRKKEATRVKKPPATKVFSIMKYAAAAAVLIFAVSFVVIQKAKHNDAALFAEFAKVTRFEPSSQTRGTQNFLIGENYFHNGNFREAIDELSSFSPTDSLYGKALYFTGLSQISLNEYDHGINTLQSYLDLNLQNKDRARYYIAAATALSGNDEPALMRLDSLIQEDSEMSDEAQELKDLLSSFWR